MPMAFVKGGAFIMGKNKESKYYDTTPEHKVNIHDYFIGKHEVTVAQFKVFIESTNYLTTAEQTGKSQVWDNKWRFRKNINWKHNESGEYSKENCPVVHVSYKDAVAYCQWLSKTTGGKFRLPTEAEWEYAAKGGQYTQAYKYSGSNNIDEVAWYGKNSHHEIHPVGEKQPNELDIYDMTGNVAEWCYDWYNKNYYSISPEDNPKGPPESPEEARRVIRGQDFICSFLSDDNVNWSLLIISRDCDRETQTKADIGFRVVYIPD
ncbi:formylglycine-generating enzyme family protein [Sphingobacterium sp. SGG-5]|nr:formylglycine-generating enzyme family protein [Sphingobacterium sp. SGG-5]